MPAHATVAIATCVLLLLMLLLCHVEAPQPAQQQQQQQPERQPANQFTSCSTCVRAGWGWHLKKSLCGNFANRRCPDSSLACSTQPHTRQPLVPRISLAQLETERHLSGKFAFILDAEATAGWAARHDWRLAHLVERFPSRKASLYAESRRTVHDYAFNVPLRDIPTFFAEPVGGRPFPGVYKTGPRKGQPLLNEAPPYVSFRFTSEEWDEMKEAVEPSIPWLEQGRAKQLAKCMGTRYWPELFQTLSWRNLMSE